MLRSHTGRYRLSIPEFITKHCRLAADWTDGDRSSRDTEFSPMTQVLNWQLVLLRIPVADAWWGEVKDAIREA
jgi:hypothetical protein